MEYWFRFLLAWLIIKKKQILTLFPSPEKSYTKFAIVCAPRSGSTWLHTLLNSHTHIISYGEILREKLEANPSKQLPANEELIFHPHHRSICAVGFKVFYEYQTAVPFRKSFQEIVTDKSIFIIHLIRGDKAAQLKSLKRAEATQQWSSGKTSNRLQPVAVDPTEFEVYKNDLLQKEKEIDSLFRQHPCLKIRYEDLLEHHEKTCLTVQEFLGVSPKNLFSLLQKQSR